jgi:hypothetical protein
MLVTVPCLLQLVICFSDYLATLTFQEKKTDMAKKGIQESNFTFSPYRTDKFEAHKKSMPIIKCSCGFKILVIPDLKAMDRAIKNHVTNHKKAFSKRFTDFLTEQVLIVASNKA